MLPVAAETPTRGVWPEFVRAMQEMDPDNHYECDVLPFARALRAVAIGQADVEIPLLKQAGMVERFPLRLADISLLHVNFVLYSNRAATIDMAHMERYKIETDVAHVGIFDFRAIPSPSIEASLRKVASGRIDGFIFAADVTDPVLRATGLKNIQRSLYRRYDATMALSRENSADIETIIVNNIARMKASGIYDRIIAPLAIEYEDWQMVD